MCAQGFVIGISMRVACLMDDGRLLGSQSGEVLRGEAWGWVMVYMEEDFRNMAEQGAAQGKRIAQGMRQQAQAAGTKHAQPRYLKSLHGNGAHNLPPPVRASADLALCPPSHEPVPVHAGELRPHPAANQCTHHWFTQEPGLR